MEYTIRQAYVDDADQVAGIGRKTFFETFSEFYPKEVMTSYLDRSFSMDKILRELSCEQSQFWMLEAEGVCAGYLKLNWDDAQTDLRDSQGLEVERIYVSRDFKKRGLGKELFDKALSVSRQLGKSYIWLGVWENNHGAIKFYQSLGFVVIGTHEFDMGDIRDTDYVMRLELD